MKRFAVAVVAGLALTLVGVVSPANAEELPVEEVTPVVMVEKVTPVVEEVTPVPEVTEASVEQAVAPVVQERSAATMTTQKCLVVLWKVKSNDVDWPQGSPQVFENTGCTTPVNWTAIFKGFTQDCSNYQGDLYVDNAKTRDLIAGGVLNGPNNPIAEQWPGDKGWNESLSTRFKTDCPPPCPEYDFPANKMWEVTWGYGFEDRNGGAPKFTMESNGGLVGVNGKSVPSYMTASWHWLYVTTDRVVTYQFADGTVRTATVTGTDCAPSIVWTETPPVPLPVKVKTADEWSTPVFDCDTEVGAEVPVTRDWVIKSYTRGSMGEVVETIDYWTQPDIYVVTAEDIETLDCPTAEVPEEPTVEDSDIAPVAEVTPGETLAHTGLPDVTQVIGFVGLGAILVGAGGLMVLRRLKATR